MEQRPETIKDEDLLKFGYAPGNYSGLCTACNCEMGWIDKRASICRDCAIQKFKALKAIESKYDRESELPEVNHFPPMPAVKPPKQTQTILLTDEEIMQIWRRTENWLQFGKAVQAIVLEKNGDKQ